MSTIPMEIAAEETVGDAAWVAQFRRDGYAGPVPIFTQEQCALIARHFRNDTRRKKSAWSKGWAASDRLYHDIATRPAILDRVRAVLGPDVILWGVSIVGRTPGQAHPWHTDIESSCAEGRFVSLWIGVEHTCFESSLRFITRSHRFGRSVQEVRQERQVRRQGASDDHILEWARELDPEAELAEPEVHDGEALIFDGRAWHGSKNTHASGRRLALLLQFAAADRRVRQVAGQAYGWPFQFDEEHLPPVLTVAGRADPSLNRIVEPPVHARDTGDPVRAEVARIRIPLAMREGKDWTPHRLFEGRTPNVPAQHAHVSILAPGACPHPPHVHLDEEILIVLDGEAELLLGEGEDRENVRSVPMRPGSFAYYPSYQAHTIRNVGVAPLHYLMFRWSGEPWEARGILPLNVHHTDEAEAARRGESTGYASRRLIQGPTGFLGRLHMHLSVMEPGGGYKPHGDPHDVAIIVLSGTLDADGKKVEPYDLLYYAAGIRHGLRNPGSTAARYLVFEFERPGGGPEPDPNGPRAGKRADRRSRREPWRKFLPRWAHGLIRNGRK